MKGVLVQHAALSTNYWVQKRAKRPIAAEMFFNGFGWLPVKSDRLDEPWLPREADIALELRARGLLLKTIAHYLGRSIDSLNNKFKRLRRVED